MAHYAGSDRFPYQYPLGQFYTASEVYNEAKHALFKLMFLTYGEHYPKPYTFQVLMFETGVYLIVFGLSIRIFTRRRDNPAPKLYLWCTISLFVLDTIYVALDAVGYIQGTLVKFDALKNENWDRLFWYLRHDGLKTAWMYVGSALSPPISRLLTIAPHCSGTTNMTMCLMK